MTMPHTTTVAGTHTNLSPQYQTIARFLDTIYGAESGQCCLGFIDGDPTPRKKEPMKPEWYTWPRDRRTVIQRHIDLTQRGINVYTARCLFTKRDRSYATAQPSRWLWIDDAPADTDCTMLVQSSEHSHHAWIQLDRAVTAEEASQLQRRWRKTIDGADACSANAVGFTRVPGGINTKRHGRFAVTVAKQTNTTYRIDDLPWPDVPTTTYAHDGTTIDTRDLFDDAQIVRLCRELNRPETPLLKNAVSTVPYIQRIPARIKPGTQTYRVLTDADYRRGFRNPSGSWDASLVRYIVCKGLIFVGYDANHIAAFLDYLEDPDTQDIKGATNLVGDVQRLFTAEKLGALYAQKQRQQQRPCQLPQRKRRGRPARITPADVLGYWQHQAAGNRCIYTRKEMANALHISVRALDRHIKHLKDTGTAIIETPAHRQYSVAIFQEVPNARQDAVLGTAINTNEAPVSPQNEVLPTHTDAAQPDAENMRTYEHKGTHQPVPDHTDDVAAGSSGGVCSFHRVSYPAPAIWHAHDSDIPVTVVGYLGAFGGRAYVAIADSTTGIPLDEVTFTPTEQDAAGLGVSHPTVSTVRREMVETGALVNFTNAQTSDGRLYPRQRSTVDDSLDDEPLDAFEEQVVQQFYPPVPTISLTEAVAEAFDAITVRRTEQRIRQYLAMNYPAISVDNDDMLRRIAFERKRRTWQKQIDTLRTKPHTALMKLNKRIERIQKEALEGQDDPRYGWACALAPHVSAEIERREPIQDRASIKRNQKKRKRAEQREQQGLLAFVEACQPDAAQTTDACKLHTSPPQYDAVGLPERLRQRRGAQAA